MSVGSTIFTDIVALLLLVRVWTSMGDLSGMGLTWLLKIGVLGWRLCSASASWGRSS